MATLLALLPASMSAQEYGVPQTPPETVTPIVEAPEAEVPVVETPTAEETPEVVAQEPVVEEKAVKEKKVKEKKVKEKKVKEAKEPKEPKEKGERTYGMFNHLGVGVTGGVMDGLGATVALPVGGHIQLRGNYSVGVPDKVYPLQYTIPDMGTVDVQGKTVELKDIVVKGVIPSDFSGYLDLYLSKKGNFHLTVGVAGILAGNDYLKVSADVSKPLSQAFPNDDPSTLFVKFEEENNASNSVELAPDSQGVLHLDMKTKSGLRPYFGIGWGRVCNINSWISMNLDLGVQKVDGLTVVGYDSKGKEQTLNSGVIDHKDSFNVPVIGQIDDILDKAAAGELPYLKGFMPVVRLGLQIRLF